MKVTPRLGWFLLLGCLVHGPIVVAGGVRDLADGWLLGVGASGEYLNGQAVRTGGIWVVAGQSRLFDMAVLPLLALDGGVRLRRWPGQPTLTVGWQTLGKGLYREELRRAHLQLGATRALGIYWWSHTAQSGGQDGIPWQRDVHWRVALTVQGEWRPSPTGFVQFQLRLPVAEGDNTWLAGARQSLARVQGWQGPMALAAAIDLRPDRTPTVSLEWDLGGGGAACGLRVDLATGTLGPVLYLRRGMLLVRTSHLAHPQLGITHRLQVGFGAWGAPRW